MRDLAARAYFAACLALGWLLRSARYSSTALVRQGNERRMRKRRSFYAPLLIWLGGPLMRVLGSGVRVLPQREWAERERRVHGTLRDASIQVDTDRSLVLPLLAGRTLAALLDDPALEASLRQRAIQQATVGLAIFHRLGFTHGDAMAGNVNVDLDAGTADWFDFETVHDPVRPMSWRRADDLRALLVTCLVRTDPQRYAEVLDLLLRVYADDDVTRALSASFTSVWRRSLTFHLAQAPISLQHFQEVGRLLRERSPQSG